MERRGKTVGDDLPFFRFLNTIKLIAAPKPEQLFATPF